MQLRQIIAGASLLAASACTEGVKPVQQPTVQIEAEILGIKTKLQDIIDTISGLAKRGEINNAIVDGCLGFQTDDEGFGMPRKKKTYTDEFYDGLERNPSYAAKCPKTKDLKFREHYDCLDEVFDHTATVQERLMHYRKLLAERQEMRQCFVDGAEKKKAEEAAPDPTVELTDATIEKFVGNGITLVDIYADWCEPCRMFEPVFRRMAKGNRDGMRFGRIDADANPKAAEKYAAVEDKISLPTIVFFKEGVPLLTIRGAAGEQEIKIMIRTVLRENERQGK